MAAEGDEFVLTWSGEDCEAVDEDRTEVTETPDEVTVTLYVAVPRDGCPTDPEAPPATADVSERTHRIALEQPVDDRAIVDGGCQLVAFANDQRC